MKRRPAVPCVFVTVQTSQENNGATWMAPTLALSTESTDLPLEVKLRERMSIR